MRTRVRERLARAMYDASDPAEWQRLKDISLVVDEAFGVLNSILSGDTDGNT